MGPAPLAQQPHLWEPVSPGNVQQGAKSDVHTGMPGACGVHTGPEPTCSSLSSLTGENNIPDESCLDSNKHLQGLFGVYNLLIPQCPQIQGQGTNYQSLCRKSGLRVPPQNLMSTPTPPPAAWVHRGTHEHVSQRILFPQFPASSAPTRGPCVSQQTSAGKAAAPVPSGAGSNRRKQYS